MRIVLGRTLFFITTLVCLGWQTTYPAEFTAKVVGIKDGDTIVVLYQKNELIIRFEHIDCPEGGQAFGKKAKQKTSSLCYSKAVTIRTAGKEDRYHRLIAEVYQGDLCVNKELVRSGLAWHFTKYSNQSEYTTLQNEAKHKQLGLWADPSPKAPWEWRKESRRK